MPSKEQAPVAVLPQLPSPLASPGRRLRLSRTCIFVATCGGKGGVRLCSASSVGSSGGHLPEPGLPHSILPTGHHYSVVCICEFVRFLCLFVVVFIPFPRMSEIISSRPFFKFDAQSLGLFFLLIRCLFCCLVWSASTTVKMNKF